MKTREVWSRGGRTPRRRPRSRPRSRPHSWVLLLGQRVTHQPSPGEGPTFVCTLVQVRCRARSLCSAQIARVSPRSSIGDRPAFRHPVTVVGSLARVHAGSEALNVEGKWAIIYDPTDVTIVIFRDTHETSCILDSPPPPHSLSSLIASPIFVLRRSDILQYRRCRMHYAPIWQENACFRERALSVERLYVIVRLEPRYSPFARAYLYATRSPFGSVRFVRSTSTLERRSENFIRASPSLCESDYPPSNRIILRKRDRRLLQQKRRGQDESVSRVRNINKM